MSSPKRELYIPTDEELETLVTEDDEPVDLFTSTQQALLHAGLYEGKTPWTNRSFLETSNVGFFYDFHQPPLVPNFMISMDVQLPQENLLDKANCSYFLWKYRKPPDVVIEIVVDEEGEEEGRKFHQYASLEVPYYVIFDPDHYLSHVTLRIYELSGTEYLEKSDNWLATVGLGLKLWHGRFYGIETLWLRWCDKDQQLISIWSDQFESVNAEQRAHARLDAEQRAHAETQARLAAEAEIVRLKALLEQHR
jgi:Putative restriction endonuclease